MTKPLPPKCGNCLKRSQTKQADYIPKPGQDASFSILAWFRDISINAIKTGPFVPGLQLNTVIANLGWHKGAVTITNLENQRE